MQLTQTQAGATQTEDGTEWFCIPVETQMFTYILPYQFTWQKIHFIESDGCFAFHRGKSISFLKRAVFIDNLHTVLGCLEVKLL